MKVNFKILSSGLLVISLAAAAAAQTTDELNNAGKNPGNVVSQSMGLDRKSYSPLKQINADNVSKLGLAWYGDLSERGGSYETTPIISDGRIFITSPWSKVYAFDIRTGKSWCDPGKLRARNYAVAVMPGAALVEGPYVAETFPVSVENDYVVVEA